ncbi:MAG: hypothetical protein IJK23_03220 [Clostridia bacterium]|nr:hypothetical protein [Clostridia bacterium]
MKQKNGGVCSARASRKKTNAELGDDELQTVAGGADPEWDVINPNDVPDELKYKEIPYVCPMRHFGKTHEFAEGWGYYECTYCHVTYYSFQTPVWTS